MRIRGTLPYSVICLVDEKVTVKRKEKKRKCSCRGLVIWYSDCEGIEGRAGSGQRNSSKGQ